MKEIMSLMPLQTLSSDYIKPLLFMHFICFRSKRSEMHKTVEHKSILLTVIKEKDFEYENCNYINFMSVVDRQSPSKHVLSHSG